MQTTVPHQFTHLDWPLTRTRITAADLEPAQGRLQTIPDPTRMPQVKAFEAEWAEWLGVGHAVLVNSGAAAHLLALRALREMEGTGSEIVVPALSSPSLITSILHTGFTPRFVDIDMRTLGADRARILRALSPQTRAVFLTHSAGFNTLTPELLSELQARQIPLLEEVGEAWGTTTLSAARKTGAHGLLSCFACQETHSLTAIGGGILTTDNADLYSILRMLRAGGLVEEAGSEAVQARYRAAHPDLPPDFIIAYPSYNMNPTELTAAVAHTRLGSLEADSTQRRANLRLFLANLDPARYQTDFAVEEGGNAPLPLILAEPDPELRDGVEAALRAACVEFRRGTIVGGNQLRQPYLRQYPGLHNWHDYPNTEHVHFYGYSLGNHPDLEPDVIRALCALLNEVTPSARGAGFAAALRAIEQEELVQAGVAAVESA